MTDPTQGDGADGVERSGVPNVRANPVDGEGVAATGAYEQDGQVVIYDTENPLAWIEAGEAVELERMA
ncbi:hypothetical protein BRC67_09805 [Halobacteriales archaeon QH_3_68_24]|nr:MAG: hypothetical protein BRC67_09805 [Halobacteriales archaeon QH_3_68_24]